MGLERLTHREVNKVQDLEREASEVIETGPAKNLRARSLEQQEDTTERRLEESVVGMGSEEEKRREREEREGWWLRREVREGIKEK